MGSDDSRQVTEDSLIVEKNEGRLKPENEWMNQRKKGLMITLLNPPVLADTHLNHHDRTLPKTPRHDRPLRLEYP